MPEQVLLFFHQSCSQMVTDGLLNKHWKGANPKEDSFPMCEIWNYRHQEQVPDSTVAVEPGIAL